MKYNILGRTGLKVSELCLGTMTFGDNFFNIAVVDQTNANQMVSRAIDAGINFLESRKVGRSQRQRFRVQALACSLEDSNLKVEL
jgi:predicted aldo/keto reductase-like oxidoreductase